MDKKIKFNIIKTTKDMSTLQNVSLLEIKFNKGILLNNFVLKSDKYFEFNLTINNQSIIDKNPFLNVAYLVSEYNSIDGYYYNFKFDSDIFIEQIKYKNYNENTNIYFEYDDTNLFNSNEHILDKYLDQHIFKKKYFKFISIDRDTKDIKLINISEHKLIINGNRKKLEFNKINEDKYRFKFLKNNTYYIEFDQIQSKKNDYVYSFNTVYISSYFPIL